MPEPVHYGRHAKQHTEPAREAWLWLAWRLVPSVARGRHERETAPWWLKAVFLVNVVTLAALVVARFTAP